MTAAAVGAVAAPPSEITAELAPIAARVPAPHTKDPTLDEEGHSDPTPSPADDPMHDEEMASQEPMDMGGHGAESAPSTAPGDGHEGEASPQVSPAPADADGHGSTSGMDDQEVASHEPAADGHDEEDGAENGHEDVSGGHDDEDAAAAEGERPRGVVLGGFVVINGLILGAAANGLILGAAALTRARDRAAAALKAHRTPTPTTRKDASR
jgi:hypothetical protein